MVKMNQDEGPEYQDFPKISSPLSTDDNLLASPTKDIRSIACLNYLNDEWAPRIIGFKDAADMVVKQTITNNTGQQDSVVYPIMFLYRHYLEIAIKNLIRKARSLGDTSEPLENDHKLKKLWEICSQQIKKNISSDFEKEHTDIARLIEQFCEVDPFSTAFRYPTDKNGWQSLSGITNIDIQNVKNIIGKISDILEIEEITMDELLTIRSDTQMELEGMLENKED